MTLRLRLVLALLALLTVGLTLFGVVTYRLYSRAEYDRLDERMLGAVNDLADLLSECRDFNGPVGPDEVYAVLIKPNSPPCRLRMLHDAENQPDLNLDQLMNSAGSLDHRYSTVDSLKGSTHWRVLVHRMDDGSTLVVALPTTEVKESLARLVGFETFAGAGLAALLAVGSWLIMRRGLHPLEQMAATASTITAADDLSVRVAPDDDRSEVGQLGGALNTMLGKLEGAFAEQEATEQRLRQFLADASHELRTPLTSIQGFAELFRLGADQDETDRAVTMRRIEQETARMRTLVDDLLLLARLDQTRPLERAPVDLAVLAADSCSDAVAAEPGRPITLDAPEPVVVSGDTNHLRQAIDNLVTNALRHTRTGTPIEVAARLDGNGDGDGDDGEPRAVITVRDHGDGLNDVGLRHAFDRFWQASPSRSSVGAGLGLAIVAAIAAEHDGTASVANAPDGGAVFALKLPVGNRG